MKANFPRDEAFATAAKTLGCEVAAIRAVAKVEASSEGAFLDSGEPLLLFERHHFHNLTNSRYGGARAPDMPALYSLLSDAARTPAGGYGPRSKQHQKLQEAAKLDRGAALMACSWGLFQIMGSNWKRCGFASLQLFVNAMYRSVDDHLAAFVRFIAADPEMHAALVAKDWLAFARKYNGPKQRGYDAKMKAAYLSPGSAVG